ncbi:MAG: trigger factor [Clostridiales bacterium]|nr:trigger factor [Clostridiales bacterium]
MKFARKTFAILMAGALTVGLMAGCDKLPGDGASSGSSASASSSASTGSFDYSAPFDENGLWKDVKALDYVTLATYKGIEVPSSVHAISDDDVDTQVKSILSGYSTTNQILDRTVADGDTINIDYVGKVDGTEFDGGSTQGKGTDVTIGTTSYIDDFLDQLVGHTPGETFDINVTFPDSYPNNPDLQGKDAVFSVTINYIAEKVAPELTDDFVATNLTGNYGWKTVDEMREGIRKQQSETAIQTYLWKQIDEGSKVSDTPQALIDFEQDATKANMEATAAQYGVDMKTLLSYYGITGSMDDWFADNQDVIKTQAKAALVYQAIAEDAGLSVSEDDIKGYFKANTGSEDYSNAKSTYGMAYIKNTVLLSKVEEYVRNSAVLK